MSHLLVRKDTTIIDSIGELAISLNLGDIVEMHNFNRWDKGDYRTDVFKVVSVSYTVEEIKLKHMEIYNA